MDGSDTPGEFSEWEKATEDAMEEAQLQGCLSKLALRQWRSDGSGLAKVRRSSDEGPAKFRRRSDGGDGGPAEVWQRRWLQWRRRGNDDEKKRYLKL